MTPDDVDRPITGRELEGRVRDIQRAVDVALATNTPAVPLQEHVEALLREKERAMAVAEQEREKAARALRGELERAISEGDHNLRDHIEAQVQQLAAAQKAADALVTQAIDGLRREIQLTFASSEQAIAKAETATEARFKTIREATDAQHAEHHRALKDMAEKVSKIA